MDAHSRGRADEIDPADQWVLNPRTGNYELRLDRSAGQSAPVSRPRGVTPPGPRTPDRTRGGERRPGAADAPPVPGQRRRRVAEGHGGDGPPAGRRKRRPAKSRKKKALMWTGGVTAFVVVAGAVGAYALYEHFNGNIKTIDVPSASGGFKKGQAFNILLIGTDKRTGSGNAGYGDKNSPGHADTTILFHVSADRTNATAMSIPRDLKTDIPDCETRTAEGTKVIPGDQDVRFNTSLGQAGRDPGCTMKTVQELTGLTVDHFMMADFNAVKEMTTAVGGVKVCLKKPVKDKDSHLNLPAGESTVAGEQALAFVRTRHSFGNESDLDRIKVQQQFLSSMIRQMKSDETLTSPTKLYGLAEAATNALTVDTGIGSISKLSDLAKELTPIDPKNITFATLPVVDNPAEKIKATVVPHPEKAEQLFALMKSDTSLTEVKKKEQDAKNAKANAQAALLQGPRAETAKVRVDVYNGSGIQGAAQNTINWLQNEQGVSRSTNKSNAPEKAALTTLTYAPNQADQARKLADLMGLPATALKPGTADAGPMEPMTLILGADFKGAGVPITGPAKVPDIDKVEADKKVCAA